MEITDCSVYDTYRHFTIDNYTYCCAFNITAEILTNFMTLYNVYNLFQVPCDGTSGLFNDTNNLNIWYNGENYSIYDINGHIYFNDIYNVYKYLDEHYPTLRRKITMQKMVIRNETIE